MTTKNKPAIVPAKRRSWLLPAILLGGGTVAAYLYATSDKNGTPEEISSTEFPAVSVYAGEHGRLTLKSAPTAKEARQTSLTECLANVQASECTHIVTMPAGVKGCIAFMPGRDFSATRADYKLEIINGEKPGAISEQKRACVFEGDFRDKDKRASCSAGYIQYFCNSADLTQKTAAWANEDKILSKAIVARNSAAFGGKNLIITKEILDDIERREKNNMVEHLKQRGKDAGTSGVMQVDYYQAQTALDVREQPGGNGKLVGKMERGSCFVPTQIPTPQGDFMRVTAFDYRGHQMTGYVTAKNATKENTLFNAQTCEARF